MVGRISAPPPVIALAAGAAGLFYSLLPAADHPAALAARLSRLSPIPLVLGAVAVVLAVTPSTILYLPEKLRRSLPGCLSALAIGFFVGAACLPAARIPIAWGIPLLSVARVEIQVIDDPRATISGGAYAQVELRATETSGNATGRVRTGAAGQLRAYFPADFVVARGEILSLAGRFVDGALPSFRVVSGQVLASAKKTDRFRTAIRAAVIDRLTRYDWGGLAAALLLSHKDDLVNDEAKLFTASGCAHVLSLSGMNLAVIAAMVGVALKKITGFRASIIAGLVISAAYVGLAGAQPSLDRSLIMYALHAWAVLRGRRTRLAYLLGAAFVIQLLARPADAAGLAFMLSYAALAGIALWGGAVDESLDGLVPALVRSPVSASVGAFLATAAITASFFGELRPIGLIAGIVVALLTELIMVGALIWLPIAWLLPVLAAPLAWPIHIVYQLCLRTVERAAAVPGLTAAPAATAIIALAAGSLLLYLRYRLYAVRNRIDPIDQL